MFFEINPYNIDIRLINETVSSLKKGNLIIFPTDSVYAIGCDLHNKKALNMLAKFKGEKLSKVNFSIICKNLSELSEYTKQLNRSTFKMINYHLPGPFTFILKANQVVPKLFDSNKKEVGVRITQNTITQSIVEALGNPLACSSLHNEDEPILDYYTDPYKIFEKYESEVTTIIDGGPGHIDPSTIVNCIDEYNPILIRQGAGILES